MYNIHFNFQFLFQNSYLTGDNNFLTVSFVVPFFPSPSVGNNFFSNVPTY